MELMESYVESISVVKLIDLSCLRQLELQVAEGDVMCEARPPADPCTLEDKSSSDVLV